MSYHYSNYSNDSWFDDKKALIAAIVVTILVGLFMGSQWYFVWRDVDSYIDRAQVAADRDDMVEYLEKVKVNMEGYGMTHGHLAVLFKSPATDLSLYFKSINRLIERLKGLKDVPKTDTAYQVALDDTRGIVRELANPAGDFIWATYWWLLLIALAFWCLFGYISLRGY